MRILLVVLSFVTFSVNSQPLRIAVAANFKSTLEKIITAYHAQLDSSQAIEISSGASGVLYHQIAHGAPFDLFLSADAERPKALSELGMAASTPFTYALGELVLWCPRADDGFDPATQAIQGRLAMANPRTAPYGQAARSALSKGIWRTQQAPVIGNNVAQTYQFVATGNATCGFIAKAMITPGHRGVYPVPASWHGPIVQQGVVLNPSGALDAFLDFMLSEEVDALLVESGYLNRAWVGVVAHES